MDSLPSAASVAEQPSAAATSTRDPVRSVRTPVARATVALPVASVALVDDALQRTGSAVTLTTSAPILPQDIPGLADAQARALTAAPRPPGDQSAWAASSLTRSQSQPGPHMSRSLARSGLHGHAQLVAVVDLAPPSASSGMEPASSLGPWGSAAGRSTALLQPQRPIHAPSPARTAIPAVPPAPRVAASPRFTNVTMQPAAMPQTGYAASTDTLAMRVQHVRFDEPEMAPITVHTHARAHTRAHESAQATAGEVALSHDMLLQWAREQMPAHWDVPASEVTVVDAAADVGRRVRALVRDVMADALLAFRSLVELNLSGHRLGCGHIHGADDAGQTARADGVIMRESRDTATPRDVSDALRARVNALLAGAEPNEGAGNWHHSPGAAVLGFGFMPALQRLSLCCCDVSQLPSPPQFLFPSLPEAADEWERVQEIMECIEYHVPAAMPSAARLFSQLRVLDLSFNHLRTSAVDMLCKLLFPTLEELDLSFNSLSRLPPSVALLRSLRSLSISGNNRMRDPLILVALSLLPRLEALMADSTAFQVFPRACSDAAAAGSLIAAMTGETDDGSCDDAVHGVWPASWPTRSKLQPFIIAAREQLIYAIPTRFPALRFLSLCDTPLHPAQSVACFMSLPALRELRIWNTPCAVDALSHRAQGIREWTLERKQLEQASAAQLKGTAVGAPATLAILLEAPSIARSSGRIREIGDLEPTGNSLPLTAGPSREDVTSLSSASLHSASASLHERPRAPATTNVPPVRHVSVPRKITKPLRQSPNRLLEGATLTARERLQPVDHSQDPTQYLRDGSHARKKGKSVRRPRRGAPRHTAPADINAHASAGAYHPLLAADELIQAQDAATEVRWTPAHVAHGVDEISAALEVRGSSSVLSQRSRGSPSSDRVRASALTDPLPSHEDGSDEEMTGQPPENGDELVEPAALWSEADREAGMTVDDGTSSDAAGTHAEAADATGQQQQVAPVRVVVDASVPSLSSLEEAYASSLTDSPINISPLQSSPHSKGVAADASLASDASLLDHASSILLHEVKPVIAIDAKLAHASTVLSEPTVMPSPRSVAADTPAYEAIRELANSTPGMAPDYLSATDALRYVLKVLEGQPRVPGHRPEEASNVMRSITRARLQRWRAQHGERHEALVRRTAASSSRVARSMSNTSLAGHQAKDGVIPGGLRPLIMERRAQRAKPHHDMHDSDGDGDSFREFEPAPRYVAAQSAVPMVAATPLSDKRTAPSQYAGLSFFGIAWESATLQPAPPKLEKTASASALRRARSKLLLRTQSTQRAIPPGASFSALRSELLQLLRKDTSTTQAVTHVRMDADAADNARAVTGPLSFQAVVTSAVASRDEALTVDFAANQHRRGALTTGAARSVEPIMDSASDASIPSSSASAPQDDAVRGAIQGSAIIGGNDVSISAALEAAPRMVADDPNSIASAATEDAAHHALLPAGTDESADEKALTRPPDDGEHASDVLVLDAAALTTDDEAADILHLNTVQYVPFDAAALSASLTARAPHLQAGSSPRRLNAPDAIAAMLRDVRRREQANPVARTLPANFVRSKLPVPSSASELSIPGSGASVHRQPSQLPAVPVDAKLNMWKIDTPLHTSSSSSERPRIYPTDSTPAHMTQMPPSPRAAARLADAGRAVFLAHTGTNPFRATLPLPSSHANLPTYGRILHAASMSAVQLQALQTAVQPSLSEPALASDSLSVLLKLAQDVAAASAMSESRRAVGDAATLV